MMVWRLIAFLVLLSGPAFAQPVSVRSGQHDGFARLVVTYPSPVAWEFGRTDDGYGLRARGAALRYDLTEVFRTIPRDRLSAIWVDPDSGVLRLGIGCACHAIAEPFRPGIVVIDIRDGAAPAGSPFESALQDAGRTLPRLAGRTSIRPKPRPAALALPEPPLVDAGPPPLAWSIRPDAAQPRPVRAAPAGSSLPEVPLTVAETAPPGTANLQTRLLADLSRAAAAGLVDPVERLPRASSAGTRQEALLPQPAQPPESQPDQLRMRRAGEDTPDALTAIGRPCLPDEGLDLAAWGGDISVADGIATLRGRLFEEFDRPSAANVRDLVRLYLYAGFGAEAQELITLFLAGDPDAPVFSALSHLIDERQPGPVFSGMESCDGRVALWALLAAPARPAPDRLATAAIQRAFSELPLHLRRHLGPAVADRLGRFGSAEAAQPIHDAIARAPGGHGQALAMIDAQLSDAAGNPDRADALLRNVAESSGAHAAKALISLAERALARGVPLQDADLLQLASLERELRSGPDGPELRRVLARSLALAGDAERALTEFAVADAPLQAEIWALAAAHLGNDALVALAFGELGTSTPDLLAEDARLTIADRMLELGFGDEARRWIGTATSDRAMILAARVALRNRDGRAALQHLAGREDQNAATIRAEAQALLGDPVAAQQAWTDAGNETMAMQAALQAGEWSRANEGGEGALAALVETLVPPNAEPPLQGPLARARSLLEKAPQTRADAGAFLSGRSIP